MALAQPPALNGIPAHGVSGRLPILDLIPFFRLCFQMPKRLLIGLGVVTLVTCVIMAVFSRNAHRVMSQSPRQLVSRPSGKPDEVGPIRSPDEAKLVDQATSFPTPRNQKPSKSELKDRELDRRPELKAALNNNIRRIVLEGSGDLEKLLGIDHAMADRLIDLLHKRAWIIKDTVTVMGEHGIQPGDPQYDVVARSLRQELDLEMKALVGEEKFELLKLAPQVQQRQIDLATNYAAQFREIEAPLSPDQSMQLAILMARFDVRDASGEPVHTDAGPMQYLRPLSDVPMLEAASKILTPAQLEVIRRRLVEQNMEREFNREMKEEILPAHGWK